jgi:hypothetical protein
MYTKAQPKKSNSKDREAMLKFGMPSGDTHYSKKGLPGLKNPNILDSDDERDFANIIDTTAARRNARH